MSQRSAALALLLVAGTMNAAFALPMARMRRWAWQSTWLVWSVFALLVLPNAFALAMAPHAYALMAALPAGVLLRVVLFGAGWGVAQVLFGLAIRSVGVAIAFALVLGTSACAGGLLPLVLTPVPGRTTPPALLAGVAVMVAGLAMCAYAGSAREAERRRAASAGQTAASGKAWAGVLLAVLAGLCASCMNFGLLAAQPLLDAARGFHVAPFVAANLLWVPLLAGGALPNVAYCVWLGFTKHTFLELKIAGSSLYAALALGMAVLWFGSNLAYGAAVQLLGALGPEWGWPAYMSLIVVLAGCFGFLTGEWKGSAGQSRIWQGAGMTMLVCGVVLLSRSHG